MKTAFKAVVPLILLSSFFLTSCNKSTSSSGSSLSSADIAAIKGNVGVTFTPNPVLEPVRKKGKYIWRFSMNIQNPHSYPINVLAISSFRQSSCQNDMSKCDHGPGGGWADFPTWFKGSACKTKQDSSGKMYLEIAPQSQCGDKWWTRSSTPDPRTGEYYLWISSDNTDPEVFISDTLELK